MLKVHTQSSYFQNYESRKRFQFFGNDDSYGSGTNASMSTIDERDWYLQEWMEHFGKKQAALNNELGWTKSRMSNIWHGRQRFNRDLLIEISDWLGIEMYELLMKPEDALLMRQFRNAAIGIAKAQNSNQQR
ncbi:helix-turn-helix domain-containing protein [Brevundimonas terrae]|nr:helix-turn-helix transcriptional regulator [Brevundimonas terrae]NIJ26902.1 plasmid maintenance system antidote protein VapI [Brevundimonas terrae]